MAKPGQGKRSGNAFEWKIARLISLSWSKNERDDIFIPTRSSGGMATTRTKYGKKTAFQHSDLTFSDSIGEPLIQIISVEIKLGYQKKIKNKKGEITKTKWDILDLLDSQRKTVMLLEFWKQCTRDAKLTNRIPVLIFQRNNRSACICFTETFFLDIKHYYSTQNLKKFSGIIIKISLLKNRKLIILNLNDFLQYISLDFVGYINNLGKDKKRGEETIRKPLQSSSKTTI